MDVVVTGTGAVTSLGVGVEALWAGLLEGRSGVSEHPEVFVDGPHPPVTIGATMDVDWGQHFSAPQQRRLDPVQRAALIAAREAWSVAGAPVVEPERLAVVFATGVGGIQTLLTQQRVLEEAGPRRVSPRAVPMLMANAASSLIAIEVNARAGAYTPVSACSSGAEAFAAGARLIASDEADVVIVGGAEAALTALTVSAFAQSGALCKTYESPATASRPFDVARCGFVLGEGAGAAVLESADHAVRRGAQQRATLTGWGVSNDAYHITAPAPDGHGQVQAMNAALRRGRTAGDLVGHVNCHATGTTLGDIIETRSIHAVLGDSPVLTAPKSALGHLVGAAGAVEAVITIESVHRRTIPPTINLATADPELSLRVATTPEPLAGAALSNSFAFGGQNVALLFT